MFIKYDITTFATLQCLELKKHIWHFAKFSLGLRNEDLEFTTFEVHFEQLLAFKNFQTVSYLQRLRII